jgi:hypothetical protein
MSAIIVFKALSATKLGVIIYTTIDLIQHPIDDTTQILCFNTAYINLY